MATTTNGDIELYYETTGDAADPALLLVMGLGAQMTRWPDAFVDRIVERGFHVIRYDNRDVGLSSKTPGFPTPGTAPAYSMADMAADGIAVLDAVGVEQAHICGASMGGMIVQTMAIEHATRVASMCSIMSTTGSSEVGQASAEILAVLMGTPPTGRAAIVEWSVERARTFAGPHFDPELTAEALAADYDRCWHPAGVGHQMMAISTRPDRTEALGGVAAPPLVVHGTIDPLVTLSGGEATAAAVPDARLVTYDDMAHDLPPVRWDDMIDEIVANAGRAG